MNNIIIIGRMTRRPEFKPANDMKQQYAKFTVAVNRSYGDQADFFDCILFGKRAEVIDKWFDKGSEIGVQGRMECNPYEGRDGRKRYPWTLVVEDFDFTAGSNQNRAETKAEPNEAPVEEDTFSQVEEDIPF